MAHRIAIVQSLRGRTCNFCDKRAKYDGKTDMGPWGDMCESHFREYGTGLGLGKGQRLMEPEEYLDWVWKKYPDLYEKYWRKGITTAEMVQKLREVRTVGHSMGPPVWIS